MPLSSVIGADTIIKPGVCTSTTRPASPYDGQVIYETDTDRCLVWNSTGWVQLSTGTANAPGLELVKTQTVGSGVSSVTVSDVFSSTYANYRVIVSGMDASNANSGLFWQLGSTTTGYYSTEYYDAYTGASTGANRRSNSASWEAGVTSQDDMTSVTLDFLSPNLAIRTQLMGMFNNGLYSGWVAGYQDSLTQFTSFLFAPGAGTLTGGTVRVYGYRNS